jgi:hypothetical protein
MRFYDVGIKSIGKILEKMLVFWPSLPMHTLVKMTLAFFAYFVQFYDAHILDPKNALPSAWLNPLIL